MKLGVIGGLGPLATAYFYELLTNMSQVEKDQDHLEVIIYSCPSIPDRTSYILDHTKENPLNKMIEIGKILEAQHVDYIAIPCITAHYFHEELSRHIHVPIIHLVEEVGAFLQSKRIGCAGIMATDGTLNSSLFQNELEKRHIKWCTSSYQSDVMHIIYENVKLGKPIDMNRFDKVSDNLFEQGAQKIILGCTELSIVKRQNHLDDRYLDAMEILAVSALEKCHIPIKEEYCHLLKGEKTCKQMF